jgi:hypothetical protein
VALTAVTLAEIERVFEVLERLGISREAVVIPLKPAHPGGVRMLPNGKPRSRSSRRRRSTSGSRARAHAARGHGRMTARAERTPWGALLGTIVLRRGGARLRRRARAVVAVGRPRRRHEPRDRRRHRDDRSRRLPLFVSFCSRFVFEGHGTPAPIAPTEHLVVGGPYRWVRNPGYVA